MTAKVADRFDINPSMVRIDHEPGLIVVFDCSTWQATPLVGTHVYLLTTHGTLESRIGEIKTHGPHGVSFFLAGLSNQDVSIGDTVEWEEALVRVPAGSPA